MVVCLYIWFCVEIFCIIDDWKIVNKVICCKITVFINILILISCYNCVEGIDSRLSLPTSQYSYMFSFITSNFLSVFHFMIFPSQLYYLSFICYKEFHFWVVHLAQQLFQLVNLQDGHLWCEIWNAGVCGVWNLWWGFYCVMTSWLGFFWLITTTNQYQIAHADRTTIRPYCRSN